MAPPSQSPSSTSTTPARSDSSGSSGKKYLVQVIIENKPYINDPEGETIHRDLIVKGGYSAVKSVRSAKMLKMAVNAASEKEAEKLVQKLCEELRIFNPVVSNCTVKVVAS